MIYTLGYEGRTLEEFINLLSENKIELVIDVRAIPWSRKRGFSKKELEKALSESSINYISLTELGSAKDIREALKSGKIDFEEFAEKYRDYVKKREDLIEKLVEIASKKDSVILCYEKDWRRCHRSILAEILEEKGFRVQHL